MTYLTALDPLLDEAGVSEVGQEEVRDLADWYCSPQNATHFYVKCGMIHFILPAASRRKDFQRTLEIKEKATTIEPGDAEKIYSAFCAFEADCRQEIFGHMAEQEGQLSFLNRLLGRLNPA